MFLYGIYILSEDPPVFALNENFLPRLLKALDGALDPVLFVFPSWTKESWKELLRTRWRNWCLPRSARWMCSTEQEVIQLRRCGFNAGVCHQNLFCNEEALQINPQIPKQWDAVYNATILPYKRLELAKGIKSLRLITATEDPLQKLAEIGLSGVEVNSHYLNISELSDALNTSRCGLALSAVEGGMLACTEYLLCGLPVVSTQSIGGRDAWFTNYNHVICKPSADDVVASVQILISEGRDAQRIREDALIVSRSHRSVLADQVRAVTGVIPFDSRIITGQWFAERFVAIHFLKEFLDSYDGRQFNRRDLMSKHA